MDFNEKTMQKTTLVVGLAILANLLWGSAATAIKTGYALFQVSSDDMLSQLYFAGIRFLLAGILTIIIGSFINGRPLLPTKSSLPKICVLALFQTVIQYIFYYMGCAHASGTNVAIATSTGAFFSILISSLLFRQERLNARKLLGCAMGFVGVVLINLSTDGGLSLNTSLAGEGAIILSSCAFGFSNAFTKSYSRTENPVMLCGYQFILGGGLMLVGSRLCGGALASAGVGGGLLIVYLAMVSAVAFSITSVLMKYNPVSKVSVFGFFNPIFGVSLSILILRESGREFGLRGLAALALVCAGVFIVNYGKPAKE